DYDLSRRILYVSRSADPALQGASRTAVADTASDQLVLSGGAGYEISAGALRFGPYLRVSYLDAQIDGYRETGAQGLNLAVEGQDVDSLTSVLGAQGAYATSHGFGVLTPYARVEWHHEFQDDSRSVAARYVNDPRGNLLVARSESPDRDYATLGLGVAGVFRGGVQAFVDYAAVLGLEDVTDHAVTAGVRVEF
nr:autotransporter outer membrane beta-barrel domain-containing protein [Pseudomonadota bacterium]